MVMAMRNVMIHRKSNDTNKQKKYQVVQVVE